MASQSTTSDERRGNNLAEKSVGFALIVVFGMLAIYSARDCSAGGIFAALLYSFGAAQGFRLLGRSQSAASRSIVIIALSLIMGIWFTFMPSPDAKANPVNNDTTNSPVACLLKVFESFLAR